MVTLRKQVNILCYDSVFNPMRLIPQFTHLHYFAQMKNSPTLRNPMMAIFLTRAGIFIYDHLHISEIVSEIHAGMLNSPKYTICFRLMKAVRYRK